MRGTVPLWPSSCSSTGAVMALAAPLTTRHTPRRARRRDRGAHPDPPEPVRQERQVRSQQRPQRCHGQLRAAQLLAVKARSAAHPSSPRARPQMHPPPPSPLSPSLPNPCSVVKKEVVGCRDTLVKWGIPKSALKGARCVHLASLPACRGVGIGVWGGGGARNCAHIQLPPHTSSKPHPHPPTTPQLSLPGGQPQLVEDAQLQRLQVRLFPHVSDVRRLRGLGWVGGWVREAGARGGGRQRAPCCSTHSPRPPPAQTCGRGGQGERAARAG